METRSVGFETYTYVKILMVLMPMNDISGQRGQCADQHAYRLSVEMKSSLQATE